MSLNTTTLSSAMTVTDTFVTLASTTGVVAPNFPVGPVEYIVVEQELMIVSSFSGVSGSAVGVSRGQNGTKQVAHASSAPVYIFLSSDNYQNVFGYTPYTVPVVPVVLAPLTGASIAPPYVGTAYMAHFTGTTALVTITLPAGSIAGELTLIFDGSGSGLTWTAADNISVAGTSTTAKSSVTFRYDVSTTKWIPSRLA